MNEKISSIIGLINIRKSIDAKKELRELNKDLEELDNLKEFFKEIKKLCRDSGKTNMVAIDKLESLIVEYGEKND